MASLPVSPPDDEGGRDADGPEVEAGPAARAEALAERLLLDARAARTRRERAQARRISRLLDDPGGLAFIVALTDEVLRIRDPRRAARALSDLARDSRRAPGGTRFLGPIDRLALTVGAPLAGLAPKLVTSLVAARIGGELSGYVLPAEPDALGRHIARRRAEGVRLNLNVLGEAVLGEGEAEARLQAVMALLERPDVDYVSVKVSSVCSQLHVEAFDAEVERVADRVRRLYDAALAARTPEGRPKFVNLDMEEYQDLHLTVAVFRQLLDEDRYEALDAGIVLQAYIPDSLAVLADLLPWARRRHRRGGGAIKIRIVKGANLAMERVAAELAGWPQAPFTTKAEVDANYKRMLDASLDPANLGALRIGVATHNVFEAAWALTLSGDRGVGEMVDFEMLEGMAPSSAAALLGVTHALLLYAPVARAGDRESAIAYLVRRFDENTGPENFLRHQYDLAPGSPAWEAERDRFRASVADRRLPAVASRRVQDRDLPPAPSPPRFANEPDTDFSLATNRAWLARHLRSLPDLGIEAVPAVVDGEVRAPAEPEVVTHRAGYRWTPSDIGLVDRAVAAAGPAGARWRARSATERRDVLRAVGAALGEARGRLIGIMAADGGKTVAEADPEVSEAVDLARYYAQAPPELGAADERGARFRPYGTVAVVPPWNFPLAIPAGGVLAALAAGSAVILKPAPETVATAWALAGACWSAGVPRDLLQFVPCADDDAGRRLITHPGVDAVILTGSWDTARLFLGWRPTLPLHAETSGKNAVVITAAADLDQAVADLVRSAFGHAGQKCSAASLAIVEASVYDDPAFLRQLADAVRSLRPGPGGTVTTTMGPLIRPPEGPLDDALRHLQPGETWLVEPAQVGDDPRQWSPGVKLGVAPGSPFHLTECFGPVLGVMRAADLDQAIKWQNQPAYGLTAGLASLDPAEIVQWRDAVAAGNLYVNRHTTGAVVRRQPFGGWKRSVVGPGAKAGGPHYVASLGTWQASFPGDADDFGAAVAAAWARDFGPSDPSGLAAEANVLRYRPLRRVLVRAGSRVGEREVALARAAAAALGVEAPLSPNLTADDLAREAGAGADKVRFLGEVDDELRLAAHDAGLWVDDRPVVEDPAIEILRWVREQAVSETRHRHGDRSRRHPELIGPR